MGAPDDDDFDLLFLESFEEGTVALAEPAAAASETCDDGMKHLRKVEKTAIGKEDGFVPFTEITTSRFDWRLNMGRKYVEISMPIKLTSNIRYS
ncbi:hypothetical protein ACFX1X_028959 [Malus domestica]